MMHPALFQLIRLHGRGVARRLVRGVKTPRGAVFFALGLLVMLVWLGPALFMHSQVPRTDPEQVRAFAPVILLSVCVMTLITSSNDGAIAFTPAEVNFLFPGPFTRRELILYKLAKSALAVLFTTAIFTIAFLGHAQWWLAAALSIYLALLFVQLVNVSVTLLGQTVGERAYTRGRRIALGVLAVIVAAALAKPVMQGATSGALDLAMQFKASPAGRVLLAPFDVFGRAYTAADLSELAPWLAAALLIDVALVALVLWLDANFYEASIAASQKVYERMERARRGQTVVQVSGGDKPRLGLRPLPWMAGAGPHAWRQMVTALRGSRGLLFFLFIIAIAAGPAVWSARGRGDVGGEDAMNAVATLLPVLAWVTVLLSTMLKFDFRGDLDHVATLKALPLTAFATAAGQLVTPVVVLTLVHALVLVAAAALIGGGAVAFLLAALVLAVPFNALLFGVENLLFLLFPARQTGAAAGDISAFGRQVIFFLFKLIVLAAACGVAAAAAFAAWRLSGGSLAALTAAAFVVLAVEAVALVPFVGWAYSRFDPSVDTPA